MHGQRPFMNVHVAPYRVNTYMELRKSGHLFGAIYAAACVMHV